ncbi:spore coat putative kinase YutH [Neobacillus dielmonensis]|uniref:spore coat putative kinase YutH n=1 Tax=Neobacillus dielmonensis TaxID=1347369 RepID=UPI0005A75E40|nr:spore coat protein YutH [Neobacillus dielmonensis]
MFQSMLEQQYGIKVENEQIEINRCPALKGNGWIYLIANPGNREEESIQELVQIAEHLNQLGDKDTAIFMRDKKGNWMTDWEQRQYCVLASRQKEENQRQTRLGRKLAKFHERGRRVPFQIQRISRIGQWKRLWEQRLEQMEKVWNGLLFQAPEDEFERMFIESFPYFMGLTENAIQYLVDTELDDDPLEIDSGTVCHERFTQNTWSSSSGPYAIKFPFDWVFDHRSRDLAEWTRERYWRNIQTYDMDVRYFFEHYQSVSPLSSFSWRLLYSRLIFPLHYFECVESYYITQSEQEKKLLEERMGRILKQSSEYERFLAQFFQLTGAPVRRLNLPQLEWLYH